ncbi:hypothetical protein MBLNU230_g8556t1 [Neophaeotheca triangularis]
MAVEDVVAPTERETKALDDNTDSKQTIQFAQDSDAADRSLTIMQACKKYKKAVTWALLLSTALIMEGYDIVIITSFYGQSQFQQTFGVPDPDGEPGDYIITPHWQTVLSNAALLGQLTGLLVNGWSQDRFGCRRTYMFFMGWMFCAVFIIFFAPSLEVLAFGEAMCGISWGIFQTLSTTYAVEIVPTILRPYVTAYVCMCWGAGILLSSGVVRAMVGVEGDLGWKLPFGLQWIWPLPLMAVAYFAPESPWNAFRRGNVEEARRSLTRLQAAGVDVEQNVKAGLAYIEYTTALEKAETESASYLECFKGTNLRRTEINCVVWAAQHLCGNTILGYSVVFLQAAGFSEVQSFNVNISLSACYIIGGLICFLLFPRFGRATIYMTGLSIMFVILVVIGGLGFAPEGNGSAQLAIGILLVMSTLANMISVGPVCYPIVAETPSGRLRYKTICIGRFTYNLVGLFHNSVTPRMLSPVGWNWGAKAALFYAGTNLCCNIWCWFRLPETKDRPFGEIDIMFENKVKARKFRTTDVDQFSGHGRAGSTYTEEKTATEHVEAKSD